MARHLLITTALLVLALASTGAVKSPSVVETWSLVSDRQIRTDGSVNDLYGARPLGQLIYDSAGHMSVHLLKADLPKCGSEDRRMRPDAAARSAFDNYLGYWGRYEVAPDGRSVTHSIEGASVPDWIGTSQHRFIQLSGDTLTITTPPQMIAGVESSTVLTWKREP